MTFFKKDETIIKIVTFIKKENPSLKFEELEKMSAKDSLIIKIAFLFRPTSTYRPCYRHPSYIVRFIKRQIKKFRQYFDSIVDYDVNKNSQETLSNDFPLNHTCFHSTPFKAIPENTLAPDISPIIFSYNNKFRKLGLKRKLFLDQPYSGNDFKESADGSNNTANFNCKVIAGNELLPFKDQSLADCQAFIDEKVTYKTIRISQEDLNQPFSGEAFKVFSDCSNNNASSICKEDKLLLCKDKSLADSFVDNEVAYKTIDISQDDFKISQTLANLSTATTSNVLPKGTKNIPNKFGHSFKDCIIFEGSFQIREKEWKSIYVNNQFVTEKYVYYFRNRLARCVNNVCQVVFQYKKQLKKNQTTVMYLKCIYGGCKKFKISVDRRRRYATVTSSSKDYCHVGEKKTAYVKGLERTVIKKNLYNKKPSEYNKVALLTANQELAAAGNLQNIKSDCTIRKIKSECYKHLDRDKDDILDLVQMQKCHPEYIKEIAFPFCVKLYSLEQLRIACSSKPVLYFDATGGVVRNPFNDKRVYLYTGVVQVDTIKRLSSVFDMISSHHFAKSIVKIFQDFRIFCEEHNKWPIFRCVVTDFSFANLHGIALGFNRMTLAEYLELCFTVVMHSSSLDPKYVAIHLCCAHFMKMVMKDVEKHFADIETKNFVKKVIILFSSLKTMDLVRDSFINFVILINTKNAAQMETSVQNLKSYFDQASVSNDDRLHIPAVIDGNYVKNQRDESGHNSSPFFLYFSQLAQQALTYIKDQPTSENKFYSPNYLNLVLTKYMPYFPLWSSLFLEENIVRVSNAPVENYFGFLKHTILKGQRNLKCSRFIRQIREHVLAIKKEIDFGIPKDGLTTRRNPKKAQLVHKHDNQIPSLKDSQEIWNRRVVSQTTKFSGRFLKKKLIVEPIEEQTRCVYCGGGAFNATTDWVQCDRCSEWVHQNCEPNITFTGEFVCKICTINKELQDRVPHAISSPGSLPAVCHAFLEKLQLSDHERKELEVQTRGQSCNNIWATERQKRITASNFGAVCLARSTGSYESLVKTVIANKKINTAPINHGRKFEDVAINKYEHDTGRKVMKCGLIVHPKHAYIGGSPDALVGDDGIVEAKCPYSARFLEPMKCAYFNKEGLLPKHHRHQYQIQGLLEITGRKWCDLVVYTFKGIAISRIYRDSDFWNIHILPKIKEFYYYYLLPQILRPMDTIPREGRRWTLFRNRPLNFNNGLFDCTKYYGSLGNTSGYVVAVFNHIRSPIKEIIYEDFATLDGTKYIAGFVIDVALCILNKNAHFQILTTPYSFQIYKAHDSASLENFVSLPVTLNGYLAMPVHINSNHWCLAIVNCTNKIFTFINPLGSTIRESEIYLKKFIYYLEHIFNKHSNTEKIDTHGWKTKTLKHTIQKDGYNCGAYIIYYFSRMVNGLPLTDTYDMNLYRLDIKRLILENSDPVHNLCLYCGRSVAIEQCLQCSFCKRYIHLKCLIFRQEDQNMKACEVCKLCQLYV